METQELTLPHTTTQYNWSISCDVSYVYQVAAVNPCGQSAPFATVQQNLMCGEPKNEVGCRDETVPKTVETRRHCEED